MRFTSKKTGHSFNLSGKGAADFFYAKNAKGEFVNDDSKEISDFKYYLCLFSMMALMVASAFLHIHLNY